MRQITSAGAKALLVLNFCRAERHQIVGMVVVKNVYTTSDKIEACRSNKAKQ